MNLLTTERRLTRWWFLVVDLSLTFLKTKTTDEVLQQSGKEDPFRHMLKSSACMYGSSGWQFLRTTMGNPIRTWCLWWIKGCYDLFNHFESCRNTMQSQINSRRGNSERDHQEIINESSIFLGKVFSKQFCFIRFFFLLKIASHFTNWSIYKLLKK